MTIDYRVGDTREVAATIPDGSVSLVASSPPFIALRSYLPDDHPEKHREIGSEPDPATFLDTLLALTAEWGRVLAPWGSIAIELGDTYSSLGGTTDNRETSNGGNDFAERRRGGGDGWPRAKSLALIPQLYATSLAYGRNLLTGQPSPAGQWLVRNVIVWHRPNPAVGALGDKVRPSTSYITVATRSPKRWFDLDAVRTKYSEGTLRQYKADPDNPVDNQRPTIMGTRPSAKGMAMQKLTHAGAPPLDCWFDQHDTWTLTTQPSKLAHYAMWPAKLAERLILMMCPAEVCTVCGEPRRRITGKTPEYAEFRRSMAAGEGVVTAWDANVGNRAQGFTGAAGADSPARGQKWETLGWSDCGHNAYTPGTVLDPFAGTGTTLAVADLHGRNAIGIDIDERNRDLMPRRMDECARALFNVTPQMKGQIDIFGEVVG